MRSLILTLVVFTAACGERSNPADGGIDAGEDAGVDAGKLEDGGTDPCGLLPPANCSGPVPTYSELAPLIVLRCESCHSGMVGGPWPLKTYQHLSDWQDAVRSEILNCRMPPVDSGVPITYEERQKIFTWVRCGLPR